MLLEIRHHTEYRYAEPIRESLMELRMQPQTTARQRLISYELTVDPAAQVFAYADNYGNTVQHFDVPYPHDRLTISARTLVETSTPPPLPAYLDRAEWDHLSSEQVRGDWFDFLLPQGYTAITEKLAAFSKDLGLNNPRSADPLTAVQRLCTTLYEELAYTPGVTEADSPIDHALDQRSGVCQDFSHIMIALCRQWGVPARYVSGYLYTDREADRSRPDATHAWVEAYFPSLRWVGFDPTNNLVAGERHVAVGWGRDYSDVPPSRGVYKGDVESELFVAVSTGPTSEVERDLELVRIGSPRAGKDGRAQPDAAYREYQQQQQQA